jgi:adenylate cyclase class 2
MYEVELKFPLVDAEPVLKRLAALGARQAPVLNQVDRYFNHPSRNFAETDEALRIRDLGDRQELTYKGPILDSQTKTRHEIEVPLANGESRDKLAEVLRLLGFREVGAVQKVRQPRHLVWMQRDFEIALDEVAGLGPFIELETLATDAERPAAVEAVLALAAELGLSAPERKSYIRLLLEKTGKIS